MKKTNESKELILADRAWLNLPDIEIEKIDNPFEDIQDDDPIILAKNLLKVITKTEYIHMLCSMILNVQTHPFQNTVLQELWERPFPMLIASRGASKTFTLALYCHLKALLNNGTKIVVVGSGFRQAKLITEYMDAIWKNAPVYRDICSKDSGLTKDVDRYTFRINNSTVISIPTGDGNKIRGLRANIIIADEFNSIRSDIYETVIAGFAAVSSSPIENVIKSARERFLKEKGLWLPEYDKIFKQVTNQSIIAGTAGYDFETFAQYWKRYKRIVESCGDKDKLEEIFQGEIPENFNWRDYSVIRIPYELLPTGFMDDKTVARSKVTVDKGIYLNEFGACHTDKNDLILTDKGLVPYKFINIGDKVLTHKGVWRKVIKKTCRNYIGKICEVVSRGSNIPITLTIDHPFWQQSDYFDTIDNIDFTRLAELSELNFLSHIDLADYVRSAAIFDNHLYTKYPAQKISQTLIYQILSELKIEKSKSKIARKLNTSFNTVFYVDKNNKRRTKSSISRYIDVDNNLGKLIGYYAAEGSIACDGRSVQFAFSKLETEYINDVQNLLRKIFGLNSSVYYSKKHGGCNVIVNSRIIAEFFENICPGNARTKHIDPSFLYSNENFMLGFIEGYWNGDGCLHKDILATANSSSVKLAGQIRTVLSYFGIFSSLHYRKPKKNTKIRGKEVRCNEFYRLNIVGRSLKEFVQLVYRDTLSKKFRDNRSFKNKIKSKKFSDYDGLVYNLEVEDDHSYTSINHTLHNCFAKDSMGFFKRSLIESCVTSDLKPIRGIYFDAATKGSQKLKYVYGIDPASEKDNFAIAIIELQPDHNRVVYVWTFNRANHLKLVEKGEVTEHNFFAYCARKIRKLMVSFPCLRIGMDQEGGGRAVLEALHDKDKMTDGEQLIWPIIDPDKEMPTDLKEGLHIVELINFSKADWVNDANQGMKKDMQDKVLLFPRFDNLALGLAAEHDIAHRSESADIDFLENCVYEIEELKNELSTIIHTKSDIAGRDRFDTPEIKTAQGKKGRLKKDRYSALLIANMLARQSNRADAPLNFHIIGRAARSEKIDESKKKKMIGNSLYQVGWDTFKGIRRM